MIPKKVFFTKGVGKHPERLHSFEMALRDAGIEKYNLVTVSSILPPNCRMISKSQGLSELKPGQILFCVLARNATNEPNRLMASSIGAAVPADPHGYGYLSEHHAFGETEEKAGDYAEDLAATMLATTLGLDIEPNKSYDELKEEWKIKDKIVKTTNITKSALADKNGLWTTVIAAAVFICDSVQKDDDIPKQIIARKDNLVIPQANSDSPTPPKDINNNNNKEVTSPQPTPQKEDSQQSN